MKLQRLLFITLLFFTGCYNEATWKGSKVLNKSYDLPFEKAEQRLFDKLGIDPTKLGNAQNPGEVTVSDDLKGLRHKAFKLVVQERSEKRIQLYLFKKSDEKGIKQSEKISFVLAADQTNRTNVSVDYIWSIGSNFPLLMGSDDGYIHEGAICNVIFQNRRWEDPSEGPLVGKNQPLSKPWDGTSDLPPPTPVSPPSKSSFSHFPRKTDLVWQPVPGAATYSVEVDCFLCCEAGKWCSDVGKSRISASEITTSSFTFSWVGKNMGRWRVWTVDSHGNDGKKSDWQEFTYTQ
jgi:hypothetical protein